MTTPSFLGYEEPDKSAATTLVRNASGDEAGFGDMVDWLDKYCRELDLNARLILAAIFHETGALTSARYVNWRNPGGIAIQANSSVEVWRPLKLSPRQTAAAMVAAMGQKFLERSVEKEVPEAYQITGMRSWLARSLALVSAPEYPSPIRVPSDMSKPFTDATGDLQYVWAEDQQWGQGVLGWYDRIPKAKGTPVVAPKPGLPDALVPIRRQIIPWSHANRPGDKLQLTYFKTPHFTVHGTANYSPGTNAAVHANLVAGAWGETAQASWHITTDEDEAVQSIPLDEIAWHAGDGCNQPTVDVGCFSSIAMEICCNSDGNLAKALDNAAQVFVRVIYADPVFDWGDGHTKGKFDRDHFDQHTWVSQEVPPHDCNFELRHDVLPPWDWTYWLARVDYWFDALAPLYTGVTPPPVKAGNGKDSLVAGVRLPEGVDLHFLERRFSGHSSHAVKIGGRTFSFNPDGSVSRAWVRYCKGLTDGKKNKVNYRWWPSLVNVENVDAAGKHKKYTFKDGWSYISPPLNIKPKVKV